MPASLQTVGAILKEVYEPRLRKQLNDETVAIKRIERSSEGIETNVGGKYVVFPIHTRRNAGIGGRNENELLPTPGQQGYNSGRVSLKYLYGGVRLTGQTFELATKNYQAFINTVDRELTGLKEDLAKDQNRQVYGDGTGLVVGFAANGTATNTLTTDYGIQWAQIGMQIDIVDSAGTVLQSNRQITNVDVEGNTITIDGAAVTTAATDYAVRTGSVNREWEGFESIIKDSGTLFNIDPTVEPLWKSVVDANGGTNRPLSEGLMTLLADKVRSKGGTTTAIFTNLGVRRAYANLLMQQRQFTNTTQFEGGFSGLAFTTDRGEIPVVVDIECPPNRMYFVNEKELTVYRESDWSWMDRDGNMWERVTGYDAYQATLYQYSQLGCHRRNSQGVLKDITEA